MQWTHLLFILNYYVDGPENVQIGVPKKIHINIKDTLNLTSIQLFVFIHFQ